MSSENILSDELVKAARNLEERFQILRLPVYKIKPEDWNVLAPDIRNLIPKWIPVLLSNFSLVGATIEFENHGEQTWPALFSFYAPQSFGINKEGDYYRELVYRELLQYGFIPFASSEGDEWLVTLAEGPNGKIYYFEQSSWGPGKPTEENGLVYAHKNLALLLTSMAISNSNFSGGGARRNSDGVWGK